MQLANGCGSGTLYTVGGGSGRMLVTLSFFVVGSVFGCLSLPSFLALGGVDPVLASDYLGAVGRAIATLVSIALVAALIVAVARKRDVNCVPSRNYVIGGVVIGLLCVGVFLSAVIRGASPSATRCGARKLRPTRVRSFAFRILAMAGPKARACRIGVVRHVEPDRFRHDVRCDGGGRRHQTFAIAGWPPSKSLLAAGIGGSTDGVRRAVRFRLQHRRLCRRRRLRLAAWLDPVSGGAAGCLIGIRLRPLFGLSRE